MKNVFQQNDRRTNVTRKIFFQKLTEDNFSRWIFAENKKESYFSGVLGLACQVNWNQKTNIQTNSKEMKAKIQIEYIQILIIQRYK